MFTSAHMELLTLLGSLLYPTPLIFFPCFFLKIESISGTLVMRWVNSQLGRILGWVERAIQQEVSAKFCFILLL